MADRVYTTQFDSGTSQDFDGAWHDFGVEIHLSAAGTLTGGRAFFPTANPSDYWWTVCRVSDGAVIAQVDLHALFPSPTLGGWNSFTSASFSTPGDKSLAMYAGTTATAYRVFCSTDRDVPFKNTSVSYPATSGGIVSGTTAVDSTGGTTPTMPTNTSTTIYYGADVEVVAASSSPALPLIVRRIPRRPLIRSRRTRTAEPVRAQVNPPSPPPPSMVAVRRLRGLRVWRSKLVTPVRAQVNPPVPLVTVVQPRRLRGLRLWRTRMATPVRDQVNPPIPLMTAVQPRRIRHLPSRRARLATPVREQLNPPITPQELVQPRRLRGLRLCRTRMFAPPFTIVTAVNPALPLAVIVQPRRLRDVPSRRARLVTPIPAQLNPPLPLQVIDAPRRLRDVVSRRARAVTPVPAQINPPITPQTVVAPHRLRGLRVWRTRVFAPPFVVAPQVNPPMPLRTAVMAHALRGLPARRTRRFGVPLVGASAPAAPAIALGVVRQPLRLRGIPSRRAKLVTPVLAQLNPPFAFRVILQPRRLRHIPSRRAKPVTPVRGQANPPMPLKTGAQPRTLHCLRALRGHVFAAPPAAAPTPFNPRRCRVTLRPARRVPPRNRPVRTTPTAPALPLKRVSAPKAMRGLVLRRTRAFSAPWIGVGVVAGPGTVFLPLGLVPVRALSAAEILTGNRSTRLRYDLYSRTEAALGTLDGVTGGAVDYTANASIHGGGALSVFDNGQNIDWLNDRIRPVLLVDGLPETPLGMFVVSEAPETWSGTGRSWPVKLLDKTAILDQDQVEVTYTLDAGTVITTAVVTLIASTGETNIAVTPSSATLTNPLGWDPGTSKLKIVNDLLAVAGYFSLWCDGNGQYRGEPYVRPAARPILFEFLDGDTSIYSPDFVKDVDLFGIPNKFIAVGRGDSTTAALTSSATNTDPASPYSYPSRGNRWITKNATGIEAASQAILDAYAQRRLIELTSPTSSIDVSHAFVPGLSFNNTVRLRRVPAGVDARHVITKTVIALDPLALVKSTLQEVVDL